MDLTANQLLLRGLRAVYVDVWKTYDVMGRACQSPAELSATFPENGVNLSSFREESPLRLKWRELTDPANKDVSEELKDDISELLGIVDNVDKNKDMLITKTEWDAAHAKSSPEDELIDREYVLLADGVFQYQLLAQPPGLVNPEEYPELIATREKMKKDIEARDNQVVSLRSEKEAAESRGDLFMASTIGLGASLLISTIGIYFLTRKRPSPIQPQQKTAERTVAVQEDDMAEVLADLEENRKTRS